MENIRYKIDTVCVSIALLFLLICSQSSLTYAQAFKPRSVQYLTATNGINSQIALGADIRDLPATKLSYLDNDNSVDADSCIKYAYNDPDILVAPGDSLNLDMIGIRAYKNKIVNIYLFFKIEDAYKVLNRFINMYGQFTDRPDNYSDIYNWDSSISSLSLRYQHKADLGVAIFTSKKLQNEIAANKQRSITRDYSQALSLNN